MINYENIIRTITNDDKSVNEYLRVGLDAIEKNVTMIERNTDENLKEALKEQIFRNAVVKKHAQSNIMLS